MSTPSGMRAGWTGLVVAALAIAGTSSVLAAQDADRQWMPFVGCWEPVGDSAQEGTLLCVVPGDAAASVEMQTWIDGEMAASEIIVANGAPNELQREECSDVDVARFSESGNRLYLQTEHLCEGQPVGTTSALLAMVSPSEWVDIQVVEADGGQSVGVIRYRVADDESTEAVGHATLNADRGGALRSSRVGASRAPVPEDLIEASRHTVPAAQEAWLLEHGDPLDLDADALVLMADNGVPESVIDMAIAVSYPRVFAVQVTPEGNLTTAARPDSPRARGVYGRRGFCGPFGCASYGYGPFYRSAYGGYGSGYGYGIYGGYGYWGYAPRIVVVDGDSRRRGRVVRGRGYTRGDGGDGGGAWTSGSGDRGGSARGSSRGRRAKPRGGR